MTEKGPRQAPLLDLDSVSFSRAGRLIVDAVSLTVGAGEIVTLIGPNGCGKTTLVRLALGLEKPDRGRVTRLPGTVGYVPQKVTIDETMPLTVHRFLRLGAPGGRGACRAALAEVGAAALLESMMHSLSSGESRRVLLARALLRRPALLVLDEPTQGVDVGGQGDMYRLIRRLRDSHGCGVLLVSHDLHLVMKETDRVLCLNRHICCSGAPEAVSRDPEYLSMFGQAGADALAVYAHHHDHAHTLGGSVESSAGDDGR